MSDLRGLLNDIYRVRRRRQRQKRSPRPKRTNQRAHFIKRARQRYGVKLSNSDVAALVRQIQAGESEFVCQPSRRCSVHAVSWEGRRMCVVYDKSRQMVVTVLPEVADGCC